MVDKRTSWLSELGRRGVFHVAGLYAVGAWILVQVADTIAGPFPLPDHALRLIWIAIAFGFPIALIFGWRYDITRDGIVRTDPRAGDGEHLSLRRSDFGIITALGLVAVAIIGVTSVEVVDAIRQEQAVVDPIQPSVRPAPNSIAVLPFETCKANPSDEMLPAALAAELISWLADVPELKVVARASSFAFQGSGYEIQQITSPLQVANVLMGVLCRDTDSLRLDVELVDPDGFVIAGASFRQADDPGLPQVATLTAAVAGWVSGELGVTSPPVIARACDDLDAHQQFIIGREYMTRGEVDEASRAFEHALVREPDCSDARAGLALAKIAWQDADPIGFPGILEDQESAVRTAVEQAPESDYAASAFVAILQMRGKDDEAEQVLRDALLRLPRSALLHHQLATLLETREQYAEAEAAARRALALDPTLEEAWSTLASIVGAQYGSVENVRVSEEAIARDPVNLHHLQRLAWVYYGQGSYHDAMRVFERIRALPEFPPVVWRSEFMIAWLTGRLDKATELALDMLENGGEDLNVDIVRWHLCVAGGVVLGQLGLHDEMNRWMAHMDKIAVGNHGHFMFNIQRLQNLGEWDAAAQVARAWLESLGPGWTDTTQARSVIPWTLVNAAQYQAVIDLVEPVLESDADLRTFRGSMEEPLAIAYKGLRRDEEAAAIIERLVADIPEREEAIIKDGWREVQGLADLSHLYVLAGRYEDAFNMGQMAIDNHYRLRIVPNLLDRWADPYAPFLDDPRVVEQIRTMHDDLDRQAERVKKMFAGRDLDALFRPMYDEPERSGGVR
ncbi:MAG: hypothetical protein OEQ74_00535 [Gammaproteobacteria bacterium]|nr:hypothetical protein [Gammaproteobacteria bacterium]